MTEWIKCSDRMPSGNRIGGWSDEVLVCVLYKDGSGHSEMYGHFDADGLYWDEGGSREREDDEIWYWQPFPAPPKLS